MATKAEKEHMARVAALGCLCCLADGYGQTPAHLTGIHHVRRNTERRNNSRVLPLCGAHHQTGGHGVAVHAGEETWEARYGSQEDLLVEVWMMLYG